MNHDRDMRFDRTDEWSAANSASIFFSIDDDNEWQKPNEEPQKEPEHVQARPSEPAAEEPVQAPDFLNSAPEENRKWGRYDEIAAFGISLRGRSHIKSGAPCQDSNDFLYLEDEKILIAAIADGVGSCNLSHWGAYTAVQEAIRSLQESIQSLAQGKPLKLGSMSQNKIEELFNKAFSTAQEKVEALADRCQQSVVHFQSTLTVALYDGSRVACCHIGDDGIVAQGTSGKYQMITRRIKGEEANSVFTLQSGKWFITNISTDITGFLMSTDGILDFYVTNEARGNRVYYPFLERFLYGMKPRTAAELSGVVEETMNSSVAYLSSAPEIVRVTDDITILAVANQRHLCEAVRPAFSQAEWEAEEKRIQAELEKNLAELNSSRTVKPKPKSYGTSQGKNSGSEYSSAETARHNTPPATQRSPLEQTTPRYYTPPKSAPEKQPTYAQPQTPSRDYTKQQPNQRDYPPYPQKGYTKSPAQNPRPAEEDPGYKIIRTLGRGLRAGASGVIDFFTIEDITYYCPVCRTEVFEDENFCSQCGLDLRGTCPYCHKSAWLWEEKCGHCGRRLTHACPRCGKQTRIGLSSCIHCKGSIRWRK